MLVGRLISMIEEHADELAERVAHRLREDPRTEAYRRFEEGELAARARAVFANLGRWLDLESDEAVAEEYEALGRRRREEGVPLAQVVWALLLTRRTLWQFVDAQGADSFLELRQQLDLELLVVRFFDRAVYFTVKGYESAGP